MASFTESEAGSAVRFELEGRLDSAAVGQIELPLTASLRRGDRHALIDLANVPFMGSLAIRMLISAARVLQRAGRRMVLVGAQPQVMEVFETVALSDLIPIAATTDEALQAIGT